MKNPIKGALHIAKMRRLGKGPKIADLKGIESSPLMKQRRSVPYMERQPFALGGQPTQNVDATQQQPQNQVQPAAQASPSSFISNVYNQYGGRNPNQDEVNYWQNELNKGSTAQQVYQGISRDAGTLSGYSGQYNAADPNSFRNMLTKTYQSYLGGGPNESDIAFWQNELNKGSTAQQIVSGIANDQAAKNFSNQQLSQWAPGYSAPNQTNSIQGLYQTYLGRDPNQDEVNYWSGQIGKGSTLGQVEDAISNDPGVIVRGIYQGYMGRDPNQDESNYWKGQLARGSTAEQIESSIANDPGVVIGGLYQDYLGRGPNQDEMDYWKGQFAQGATADQIEAAISNDPGVIVRSAYQDYAGRDPTSEETMSGMNLLGPNRDIASFIDKTFSGPNAPASNFAPYQVASASNSASIMDSIMRPLTAAEKAITDMISNRECAKDPNTIIGDNQGPGSGQFSKAIGYQGNLVDMTINQVLEMQKQLTKLTAAAGVAKGKGSSAVGTGQFVRGTLIDQLKKLGITPDLWDTIKFTPELQKKLTLSLFKDAVTGGKDLNNVDPAKWNRRRLMSQWESFDTRKGKAPLRPAEIKQVRLAQGSVSPMPEGAPGPLGEIVQETTPSSGAGGGTYSDALATQNFLNDYLYDSNVRGTNVLNLGGGSSGGGPGGGSGSGGSSAGTPGSHAGTHGASAMPTVNHPVSHGSGSVSFAPPASFDGGSGTIDPYFGHVGSTHLDPRWGSGVGVPSSDWEWDYARKSGGSVTHDSIRKRGMDALQAYASGGKVWDKKRPKSLGKPEKLSKDQKRSAKAAAKAAGRPYPNLIDNMRAAQKADGGEIKAAIKLAHKRLTHES